MTVGTTAMALLEKTMFKIIILNAIIVLLIPFSSGVIAETDFLINGVASDLLNITTDITFFN
ncbi:MAG: hypothetical protein ACE5D6_07175, partial [Candidatus Zixiibacteriota bacterium]